MMKSAIPVMLAFAVAAPAAATVTIQTRTVGLSTLDDGSIGTTVNFRDFDFFDLTGESLRQVTINVVANINGRTFATNNATGGNSASRQRSVSATYALTSAISGNGLSAGDTASATQTRPTVAGNGTVATLNQLNPGSSYSSTITSGFAAFATDPVQFAFSASALLTTVPAANVVYSAGEITGGRADIELIYTSAIPEPATWTLLAAGFGLVGVSVRRRQRTLAA